MGWPEVETDLRPFIDEEGQKHQHSTGRWSVNFGCLKCKADWTVRTERPLRCWCGWYGGEVDDWRQGSGGETAKEVIDAD